MRPASIRAMSVAATAAQPFGGRPERGVVGVDGVCYF